MIIIAAESAQAGPLLGHFMLDIRPHLNLSPNMKHASTNNTLIWRSVATHMIQPLLRCSSGSIALYLHLSLCAHGHSLAFPSYLTLLLLSLSLSSQRLVGLVTDQSDRRSRPVSEPEEALPESVIVLPTTSELALLHTVMRDAMEGRRERGRLLIVILLIILSVLLFFLYSCLPSVMRDAMESRRERVLIILFLFPIAFSYLCVCV